jgi:hypothetical protein
MMTQHEFEPIPNINSVSFRVGRMAASTLARIESYFCLPCPLCGVMFTGYEWKAARLDDDLWCSSIPVDKSEGHHQGICPWCTEAGRGCLVTARELGHSCRHGVKFDDSGS